ncbi:hypothetical protein GCM10028864_39800 [Microlunatus parietis]
MAAVSDQRLGPGSADRCSADQRGRKVVRERMPLLQRIRRCMQLVQRGRRAARTVRFRAGLEIEAADSIGSGLQEVRELIKVTRIGVHTVTAVQALQDDPLTPRIGSRVSENRGHREVVCRVLPARPERQLW